MNKKLTAPLLTVKAAKNFVSSLMENLFVEGKIELVNKFYTQDVIFHYHDEIFCLDEIRKRILAIKNNTIKYHIMVEDIVVISDLIVFRVKQTWMNIKNKALNESLVLGVYRMRGKKVCEGWLMMDEPTWSYAETNRNFIESMQAFQLNLRDKKNFLKRLSVASQFHGITRLSKTEQECLYYYFHGFSAKETALKMGLSFRTIESYLANIKDRFGCKTKLELRKKIFSG